MVITWLIIISKADTGLFSAVKGIRNLVMMYEVYFDTHDYLPIVYFVLNKISICQVVRALIKTI